MRRKWLWVCLFAVFVPIAAGAQQETEVTFDPTPVALPQSDAGSPRLVTSKDLLLLREIHGASISPDGQWVAFVVGQADYESNGYRSGLFLVQTSGEERHPFLSAPPACRTGVISTNGIARQPQWSEDSRFVFYRTRMKLEEPWQVWRWETKTGERKAVDACSRRRFAVFD